MPDESPKTKPEKLPKTKTELEALVLAELRAASQCGGAVHVTVVAYDDYRVGATWMASTIVRSDLMKGTQGVLAFQLRG